MAAILNFHVAIPGFSINVHLGQYPCQIWCLYHQVKDSSTNLLHYFAAKQYDVSVEICTAPCQKFMNKRHFQYIFIGI
jgi:hypothetical protein